MTTDAPAEGSGVNSRPRAQRFTVECAVRYRTPNASAWERGRTINLSQSGVLFAAAEPPVTGAALELTLELASPLYATAVIARTGPGEAGSLVGAKFQELFFFEGGVRGPPSR